MIPSDSISFNIDESSTMPSLTYKVDYSKGRITGMIEGKEALSQTIYKIIGTERYAHMIYNWYFGVEMIPMIGQDFDFVQANIKKVILDALTQDDRITGIENLKCVKTDIDSMLVTFTALTSEGDIYITKEYANVS